MSNVLETPTDVTERAAQEVPSDAVEVRRNGALAAVVGTLASAVAIAYLARAAASGSWVDIALCAVLGVLAVAHLVAFVDARTPLLVADDQGVRIRLGRTWRGMPWSVIDEIEHTPRRRFLRDGKLVVLPAEADDQLADLDRGARRQSRAAALLHGDPFAVPLGLSTRVVGADGDLTAALLRLSGGATTVVEVDPGLPEQVTDDVTDDLAAEPTHRPADEPADEPAPVSYDAPEHHDEAPRPSTPRGGGFFGGLARPGSASAAPAGRSLAPAPVRAVAASPTPTPLRDPVTAVRAEVTRDLGELTVGATALHLHEVDQEAVARLELPELAELRPTTASDQRVVLGDRVSPISRPGEPVASLVIDEFAVEPAEDPVVGPELAAARTRLGLSVDQLAERTRIRPHVIESIEVDDFAPCGGDFYARGHLRTLARVVGIDVAPLLAVYDERYADAPINPRRVFEAELATGAHGPIRGTRGGPNWSVLVAAVMALVLAWSVARLVMDRPVELAPAPSLTQGSGGLKPAAALGDPVPVVLSAAGGGARVVVRDGENNTVFSGDLAFGQSRTLPQVTPPVRVQTSDGSLRIGIDGQDPAAVGETGRPGQRTFVAR